MPMVKSSRDSGSIRSSMDYDSSSALFPGLGYTIDATTKHEDTYSFRTGRSADVEASAVKLDPLSETYSPPGNLVEALVYRKRFLERQIVMATSRPGAPSHFAIGDMGHEFANRKLSFVASNNSARLTQSDGRIRNYVNLVPRAWFNLTSDGNPVLTGLYTDSFSNHFSSLGFPSTSAGTTIGPSKQRIRSLASSHISEMNPFSNKASVLATLMELARGDIPNLLKSLRQHMIMINRMKASGIKDAASALGSEYLNNVFGWSPIIRDVDSSIKVLLKLDALLFPSDSTRRKVERVISTRGVVVENNVDLTSWAPFNRTDSNVHGNMATGVNSVTLRGSANFSEWPIGPQPATISLLEELSVRTSARFLTSARPSVTNNSHLDRAIDLLGLELTPEVLWELTPWSWLIDWFSNMGTVISNLTSLGLSNTILNYAYSTARLKTGVGMSVRPQVTSGSGLKSFSGTFNYFFDSDLKVRIAASPFGFDVSTDLLNPGQWGILAALGLARSR